MSNIKIKRFIECLIPVTACNLKCEYCYVMQENRRKNEIPKFTLSPEQIALALSPERMGGVCYISICGAGETLIPLDVLPIALELLKEGHYINITTNGTLSKRFEELSNFPTDCLHRMHFAFSLHYLELKDKGLLDVFVNNVKLVHLLGCSFVVQINLYDGYIPYWDEIKDFCISNFNAPPQVAATRLEGKTMELYTALSKAEYIRIGEKMNSPLFEYTIKNFGHKQREFCYAGDWAFLLNLCSGEASKCYNLRPFTNIYKDLKAPIKLEAIGKGCPCQYCINSSHFMSLGCIPSIDGPSYASLRNREEADWYTPEMKAFLSQRLGAMNKEYSVTKKLFVEIKRKIKYRLRRFQRSRH